MTRIELQLYETVLKELPRIRKALENSQEQKWNPKMELTKEEIEEMNKERLRESNVELKLKVIDLQNELNNLKNK